MPGKIDRLHDDVGILAPVEIHEGPVGQAAGRGHEGGLGGVAGGDIFGRRPGGDDARGHRTLRLREHADEPRAEPLRERGRQFETGLRLGAGIEVHEQMAHCWSSPDPPPSQRRGASVACFGSRYIALHQSRPLNRSLVFRPSMQFLARRRPKERT
ncbi:MAG: hypothetical protein V9G24_01385 [Rhodoblastus sp.]